MKYKFILEGSVVKALMRLSWPVAIAMIVQLSYGLADTFFVAKLGAKEVAAVTYSFPIMFIFFSLAQGLAVGTTSLIAQYYGKKDIKNASNVAEHSLFIAVVIAVLLSVVVEILQKHIFMLLGADKSLISLIMSYSTIMFGAVALIFVAFVGNSILRGIGDMKTPMRIMLTSSLLNMILDPFFIFGLWFFPRLGIAGAAVATVISRSVMVILIFYILLREKEHLRISLKFRFKPKIFKEILKVGLPASVSSSMNAVGAAILMFFISAFGSMAVAAWGIIMRIESIIFLPMRGIGVASVTMIGQNLGAKKEKRATKTAIISIIVSVVSVSLLGAVLFFYSGFFMGLFVSNKKVISFGILYFTYIVFSYPFQGLLNTGEAILQGSGRLKHVVLADLMRWAILLGAGISVLKSMNLHLFFILFMSAYIVSSLYIAVVLLRGKWKKPVIMDEPEVAERMTEID